MTSTTLKRENPTEPQRALVLAIGPWHRGEFAIARDQIADGEAWCAVGDCETASELLARDELLVDFILLAQTLPGVYLQAEIDVLRRLAPLAQIVVVAGTWCEGELRTGKPLTGVLRLYWYEVAPWWESRDSQTDFWSPCLDGSIVPRLQATAPNLDGRVAIHSPTLASFESLAAALNPLGAQCVWVRDSSAPESATLGIWDGGQLDLAEWEQLNFFAAGIRDIGGSLVVLLDFPRKEHIALLQTLGCKTVLGKPYVIAELIGAIHRLRFRE
jgi:hypothetical protein